ncbi:MAG: glutamine--fructose-6-phosphate transaminase (isomerizing) [Deltaproteobacteria bacterium]|nr:glutamine--fructose-6-phosphate transaminase (isomerizing) [Deltaproteobacteria bacterium]
MCGIVGYVGSPNAAEYVLEGLRRLEYRGYDSAGIATVHQGNILLQRKKGKLAELTQKLAREPLAGNIAIGHTRWATHGKPSDENAHPHRVDDILVVHNGIIENFHELREELTRLGRTFTSETDTEIMAHLIHLAKGDLEARVRCALAQVKGAYAIAVIAANEPDTIVVAKNASPLVIGVIPDAGMIASDIPALLAHTREVIVLGEDELAVVRPGSVRLSIIDGRTIERQPRIIDWSPVMAERGGHKHFMHKEIHEQPRAIINTLRGRLSASSSDVVLDQELIDIFINTERITLTACGTSWHACLVGRLAFEDLARLGCEVELASELRYRTPLWGPKTLLLAVSQSGETADTLAAIKAARAHGSKVLSVVNVIDSSIARESDYVFYTNAGPEIGVASTKAFLTQVAALLILAIGMGRQRGLSSKRASELLEGLREIPLQIEKALQKENDVIAAARSMTTARSVLFLGRGYGYPVALEGALKLKEISYIHAEGYAAGEMKHGPIALIEPGMPIIVVANTGPLYEKVLSNIQEARAREGYIVAVANDGDTNIKNFADSVLYVPKNDPLLAPLLATIPLQLLAYHVADLLGTDIDQPRNLAKSVTVE